MASPIRPSQGRRDAPRKAEKERGHEIGPWSQRCVRCGMSELELVMHPRARCAGARRNALPEGLAERLRRTR